MRSGLVVASLLFFSACESEISTVNDAEGTSCEADIDVTAHASDAVTSSGTTVFGEVNAAPEVTVRAIYVAGIGVTRGEFNYRGWQVDVPQPRLEALSENGIARLPVVAYTSIGCASLAEAMQPLVKVISSDAANGDAAR